MIHTMQINNSKWFRRPTLAMGVALAMCSLPSQAEDPQRPLSVRPEVQTAEWAVSWWMPRHEQKLKEKSDLKDCQLVWIGDSITHGWEGEGKEIWNAKFAKFQPLNLGYSGDRTEQVLWRLEHGEVDGLSPRLAILMIGTNNAGHRKESSEETAEGIRAIVADLKKRLPKTKLLLLAIFPRGDGPDDELRRLNDKTNALISQLADDQSVYYLDIGSKFLDEAGKLPETLMPDKLHPNRRGYEIWAEAIEGKLADLMK